MKKETTFSLWKKGVKHGIPIFLGYFAVSFAFGIQAVGIGISPLDATLMSLLNLTSAGQFAALDIIASQGSYMVLALMQLIINLRYLLMSTALSQKISPKTSISSRLKMAYGITDEIFALSVTYPDTLPPAYTYGLITAAVPGWSLGTLLGGIAGQILPAGVISALGIAIYGMFVAIVMPEMKKKRSVLIAVLAAALFTVLLTYCPGLTGIPSYYRVIIVTVAVSAIAAAVFPVHDDEDAAAQD